MDPRERITFQAILLLCLEIWHVMTEKDTKQGLAIVTLTLPDPQHCPNLSLGTVNMFFISVNQMINPKQAFGQWNEIKKNLHYSEF